MGLKSLSREVLEAQNLELRDKLAQSERKYQRLLAKHIEVLREQAITGGTALVQHGGDRGSSR